MAATALLGRHCPAIPNRNREPSGIFYTEPPSPLSAFILKTQITWMGPSSPSNQPKPQAMADSSNSLEMTAYRRLPPCTVLNCECGSAPAAGGPDGAGTSARVCSSGST
ncbi:hypothetical protein Vafri_21558 [Volvox africanus]|uniref:Uncharacterized protein n=1 Tax=Volvox africanus TaxID=51714 RepID=A0A8J4BTT8_9CHLO|nr:hypothetical protein Vafri_21558 [Volvox africanus]